MDLHYSLNIGMQIQKRFYSEPGILIFGGYLFCSINPKKNRNFDTKRIRIAVLSFCLKVLISRASGRLSAPAAAR